ncbi:MAG: YihY/virulence factor BrkB family protein [Bacteroidales bacterium]|nr:YihY/virulence factor BrkB family protein [Bacteroidales bacterium]
MKKNLRALREWINALLKKIQAILFGLLERIDALLKIIGDKIIIPGFGGFSLYYIGNFFVTGLTKGSFTIRAKSMTYSLFSAIFPLLIFGFSIIPFIPIEGFQDALINLITEIMPPAIYDVFFDTISDTIMKPSGTLLSFGIITSLYFASNGILAIIEAFNASFHNVDRRNLISKRLISIAMVLILCTLIIAAMTIIIGGSKYIDHLATHHTIIADNKFWYVSLHIAKWLIILVLYFIAISFLYFLAPSKKSRYKFISPGAILATVVQILCSSGFSFYLNNFANYNKLYGSLGTIIIVLMLLYLTSISLILGFELNLSIISGKKSDAEEKQIENERFELWKRNHAFSNKFIRQ